MLVIMTLTRTRANLLRLHTGIHHELLIPRKRTPDPCEDIQPWYSWGCTTMVQWATGDCQEEVIWTSRDQGHPYWIIFGRIWAEYLQGILERSLWQNHLLYCSCSQGSHWRILHNDYGEVQCQGFQEVCSQEASSLPI